MQQTKQKIIIVIFGFLGINAYRSLLKTRPHVSRQTSYYHGNHCMCSATLPGITVLFCFCLFFLAQFTPIHNCRLRVHHAKNKPYVNMHLNVIYILQSVPKFLKLEFYNNLPSRLRKKKKILHDLPPSVGKLTQLLITILIIL